MELDRFLLVPLTYLHLRSGLHLQYKKSALMNTLVHQKEVM